MFLSSFTSIVAELFVSSMISIDSMEAYIVSSEVLSCGMIGAFSADALEGSSIPKLAKTKLDDSTAPAALWNILFIEISLCGSPRYVI